MLSAWLDCLPNERVRWLVACVWVLDICMGVLEPRKFGLGNMHEFIGKLVVQRIRAQHSSRDSSHAPEGMQQQRKGDSKELVTAHTTA